jgi:hypothetical protein
VLTGVVTITRMSTDILPNINIPDVYDLEEERV